MKNVTSSVLGAIALVTASSVYAAPPLPDFFPHNPDGPYKDVCDTMAEMSVKAFAERQAEGTSLENMQRRVEAKSEGLKPYRVYMLEVATEIGYKSNSKESAYNESWGRCYRYIYFQE
jgi:hypothetical protein